MKPQKPNIYHYNDYRKFLKDLYQFQKSKSPHQFSFRILSDRAGLGSPNYFLMVMEGARNLSSKMIPRFADALRLESQQHLFFEHLVHFTQAKSVVQKDLHFQKMLEFRQYRNAAKIGSDQYAYFSNWYCVAIREMVDLPHFQENPKWIARALTPPISEKQAKVALRLLQNLKLIHRNEQGRLAQKNAHLATDEVISALSVYQFHEQMIQKGLEALQLPSNEREISSMTLALSKTELPNLKKKIYQFMYDLQAWLSSLPEKPDEIYQLNFQLFGLTQTQKQKVGSPNPEQRRKNV